MSQFKIKQAVKTQTWLRLTFDGPSGSGKTYTALRFAHALAKGGRICLIDTERGSASKYAQEAPDGVPWAYDVLELSMFSPATYTDAINYVVAQGYDVLIIDSLSHAWSGKGGALQIKDNQGGNSFTAWRKVTPIHDAMVDAILNAPLHVIATMRSKMDYAMEMSADGRKVTGVRKIGLAPIQRQGMEYEFDLVVDIDWSHIATVSKTRCSAMEGATTERPGPQFFQPLIDWLDSGVARPKPPPPPVVTQESVKSALAVSAGDGRTMSDAKPANLKYIVDNPGEYNTDMVEAARILCAPTASPFIAALERLADEQSKEQDPPGPDDDSAWQPTTPPIPQADGTTRPTPEAKPRVVVNEQTVDAAMNAVTPSENKMCEGNRLAWAKVAANADGHYSAELAQHAMVLMEAPELVRDWMERNIEDD